MQVLHYQLMTLESRKLGMIIYALLAAMILYLYHQSLDLTTAVAIIAPIAVYAFADQYKHKSTGVA